MKENTKKTFWIVVSHHKGVKEVVEVEDIMRCLNGPGDMGWVGAVGNLTPSWIASFDQLSNTREEAIQKHTDYLKEELNKAWENLNAWKAIHDPTEPLRVQMIVQSVGMFYPVGMDLDEAFAGQFYKQGRPKDQFYLLRDRRAA